MKLVFGFHQTGVGTRTTFQESEAYGCSKLLHRSVPEAGGYDYAIFEVDRPFVGRSALRLADIRTPDRRPAPGSPVIVLGHGEGCPLKYSPGGQVMGKIGEHAYYVEADVFARNSGSPVLDASTHHVVGVLVHGSRDYEVPEGRRCAVHAHGDRQREGERVTFIDAVKSALRSSR